MLLRVVVYIERKPIVRGLPSRSVTRAVKNAINEAKKENDPVIVQLLTERVAEVSVAIALVESFSLSNFIAKSVTRLLAFIDK